MPQAWVGMVGGGGHDGRQARFAVELAERPPMPPAIAEEGGEGLYVQLHELVDADCGLSNTTVREAPRAARAALKMQRVCARGAARRRTLPCPPSSIPP
eukprot:72368-Prymnesium_polylepis.1